MELSTADQCGVSQPRIVAVQHVRSPLAAPVMRKSYVTEKTLGKMRG